MAPRSSLDFGQMPLSREASLTWSSDYEPDVKPIIIIIIIINRLRSFASGHTGKMAAWMAAQFVHRQSRDNQWRRQLLGQAGAQPGHDGLETGHIIIC